MARDRAHVNLSIWDDDDFKDLTGSAQLLYFQLLTSQTLSYAGVADWRPNRIAVLSSGTRGADVQAAADELARNLFVVADDQTEEILVRSFFRHDGLLLKPNVAKAMVTAWRQVFSRTIQGVVVHELKRLRDEFPEWKAWGVVEVQDLLTKPSISPDETVSGRVPLDLPETLPERDAPLLTTNYLLPTTDYSLRALSAREVQDLFESAYSHWPKKTERKKSFEKFARLVKTVDAQKLVADIIRFGDAYAATTDTRFVPALVVWLNGERWNDELPQPRAQSMTRGQENLAYLQRVMQEQGAIEG